MERRLRHWLPLAGPALVTAWMVGACVPVVPVLPQPNSVGRSEGSLEPIERLGRWNGERFVSVRERSVPPSHVHVIVHGWAPGWGEQVLRDRTLRSWEARDARGRPFEPWVRRLAVVIAAADPHAVVLAYSWLDDAATSRFILAQRNAWASTELHGRLLADALTSALRPGFVSHAGRVHLIGHSYGARVVTLAAIALPKAPRHLTLFDSPDSAMTHLTGSQTGLAVLLSKLPTGRGAGRVFVDNYVSMVGARYGREGAEGVVDVTLNPPYGSFAYRSRHLYPTEFYARATSHGFGLEWSPLVSSRTPRPGCYEQPYGTLELRRGCSGVP